MVSKTIFIKVRNYADGQPYGSYNDFYRMASISGYDLCYLEEIDYESDNIYIISPNIYIPNEVFKPNRTCKIILWQLERYDRPDFIDLRYDKIWVSYPECPYPDAEYVFFGGYKDFANIIEVNKCYDFTYMAYLYGERERKVNELRKQYTFAPDYYDFDLRNIELQKSRVGLCLHQDNIPLIEPIRYTIFSCYKLPLLCEMSTSFSPYFVYSYEEFLKGCNFVEITNWQSNYKLVTEERTFKICVDEAIKKYKLNL